ncbi:MAG: hypothetical protein ACI8P0_001624, partial [Planctomycetaceae bacterium]
MKRFTLWMTLLAALISGCTQTRLQSRSDCPLQSEVVARKPVASDSVELDQRQGKIEDDSVVHANGQKSTSSGWMQTSAQVIAEPNSLPPVPAAQVEYSSSGLSTLDSFEQLAISSNPTLTELQARVDAANGRWLQVGLYPNPEIAYSAQEVGN